MSGLPILNLLNLNSFKSIVIILCEKISRKLFGVLLWSGVLTFCDSHFLHIYSKFCKLRVFQLRLNLCFSGILYFVRILMLKLLKGEQSRLNGKFGLTFSISSLVICVYLLYP